MYVLTVICNADCISVIQKLYEQRSVRVNSNEHVITSNDRWQTMQIMTCKMRRCFVYECIDA